MFYGMIPQGSYFYEVIPEHRVSEYYGRGYMVDRGKELKREFIEWYKKNPELSGVREGWEAFLLSPPRDLKRLST